MWWINMNSEVRWKSALVLSELLDEGERYLHRGTLSMHSQSNTTWWHLLQGEPSSQDSEPVVYSDWNYFLNLSPVLSVLTSHTADVELQYMCM